jgi:hypothetical protein
MEIYKTDNPANGFKCGCKNTAKRIDVRQKISIGVTKSYTPALRKKRGDVSRQNFLNGISFGKLKYVNTINEKYRSKLEVFFSELMLKHNLKYTYEGKSNRFLMSDGRVKVVDFIVNDKIIEITGFAYKKWQDDFIKKIINLNECVKKPIIIITYNKYVEYLCGILYNYKNMKVINIENIEEIIKTIKDSNE